jgi:hypothetical protein
LPTPHGPVIRALRRLRIQSQAALQEQGPIEPAMRAVVDVLDAGRMAQPRRAGAGLEPLLAA